MSRNLVDMQSGSILLCAPVISMGTRLTTDYTFARLGCTTQVSPGNRLTFRGIIALRGTHTSSKTMKSSRIDKGISHLDWYGTLTETGTCASSDPGRNPSNHVAWLATRRQLPLDSPRIGMLAAIDCLNLLTALVPGYAPRLQCGFARTKRKAPPAVEEEPKKIK